MLVLILKVRNDYIINYIKISTILLQLLYQLKDHVLQIMEDVIKFVLMSLELYSVIVKRDISALHSYLQNALVSFKLKWMYDPP